MTESAYNKMMDVPEFGACVCRDGFGDYCRFCMPTHRVRRGKIVEIPEQWRGKVTNPQTIRKRLSKQSRKTANRWVRRLGKYKYLALNNPRCLGLHENYE